LAVLAVIVVAALRHDSPAIALDDRRRRPTGLRDEDPVHAAMTEAIADRLHGLGLRVATDEPYQHFQFAGRADRVAWDREGVALLHCEQRTRLPNFQDSAGTFNAKRAYLADALAVRLGLPPRLPQCDARDRPALVL